jgi:hypothetical protein
MKGEIMFLDELKRAIKDPFMQGAIVGVGTYCVLLIVFNKSITPTHMNMTVNIPKEVFNKLLEGEVITFDSNIGELALSKISSL